MHFYRRFSILCVLLVVSLVSWGCSEESITISNLDPINLSQPAPNAEADGGQFMAMLQSPNDVNPGNLIQVSLNSPVQISQSTPEDISTPANPELTGQVFALFVADANVVGDPSLISVQDIVDQFILVAVESWPGILSYVPSNQVPGDYLMFFVWSDGVSPLKYSDWVQLSLQNPGISEVTPQIVASRTSGVAPLAVFFDATGTTHQDGGVDTFHDLHYAWNFGDPGSGTWSTSGLPKNGDRGPVGGHVFEQPGTYTVTVLVYSGNGGAFAYETVQITVDDPDVVYAGTDTVCVSQAGNFADCPPGAATDTTTSFSQAMSHVGTGKRVLLRRGELWTTSGQTNLNSHGPVTIGAFGDGSKPEIHRNTGGKVFRLSASNPQFDDVRIMDLHLRGTATSGNALDGENTVKNLLALRLDIENFSSGVVIPINKVDYWVTHGSPQSEVPQHNAIVESTFTNLDSYGIYIDTTEAIVLGNTVDFEAPPYSGHLFRAPYMGKGVFNHNDMRGGSQGKHLVKIHAPEQNGSSILSGLDTEDVVFYRNSFLSTNPSWAVVPGPQSSSTDEQIRNFIIEANLFRSQGSTQILLRQSGEDMTIKNNIFDHTGMLYDSVGIAINKRGIEPPPNRVRVFNNTFYRSDVGDFVGVKVYSNASNSSVKNNLGSAPNASSSALVEDFSASTTTAANLLTDTPGFVVPNPVDPLDFRLALGSPAIDAGVDSVSAYFDLYGLPRPLGGATDIGAGEFY